MDGTGRRKECGWLRFASAAALALIACVATGCVSSTRADFLAVRDSAPTPKKSARVTLAEADRSPNGDRRPEAVARVAEVPTP